MQQAWPSGVLQPEWQTTAGLLLVQHRLGPQIFVSGQHLEEPSSVQQTHPAWQHRSAPQGVDPSGWQKPLQQDQPSAQQLAPQARSGGQQVVPPRQVSPAAQHREPQISRPSVHPQAQVGAWRTCPDGQLP